MDNDTNDLRPLIRAALEAGDKSGGVMTRDGHQFRITAISDYIYAICKNSRSFAWTSDGKPVSEAWHPCEELIPRPAPKRRVKVWVNVNIGFDGRVYGGVYPGKYCANWCSTGDRIACIEIDVEEGQGL